MLRSYVLTNFSKNMLYNIRLWNCNKYKTEKYMNLINSN